MIDKKHKGAFNELKACSWFLNQGYEVFRNVSAFGYVDLVIIDKEGSVTLVDVKTAGRNRQGEISLYDRRTELQRTKGVRTLLIDGDEFILV